MPFLVISNGVPQNYGSLVISADLTFSSIEQRGQYFIDNPNRLTDGVVCTVNELGVARIFKYDLQSTTWFEFTNTIKGDSVYIQYSPDTVNWYDIDNSYKYIRFSSTFGISDIKQIMADNVIYHYAPTSDGVFTDVFNPNLTYWAKISLDNGNTFNQPFRLIGENGLGFIVQYSTSTTGPWSNVFVDGVHSYFRFSNDNQNTWTPAQRFKADVPVLTEVNAIHLGGHDVISTNENLTVKNNNTLINYFPVWQGVSDDGNTIVGATEMVFDERQNGYELNGNIRLDELLPYNFTRTYTTRAYIINTTFRPAETYTGDIKFQMWTKNGTLLIYTTTIKSASLIAGQNFTIPFYGGLFIRQGNQINTKIIREDGTPIITYSGSNKNEPWRLIDMIPYRFVDVINVEDNNMVVDMLSNLVGEDRLSIDALKGSENLKIGSFKGNIDFNLGLEQFNNSLTNDFWKSESNITYNGLDFNIGDKLFVLSPIGDPITDPLTTLTDPRFYLDKNIYNIATNTANGVVKPVNNLIVELDGRLYVRQADSELDGVVKLGVPNQAAQLDSNGKLPIDYLPQFDTLRRISVTDIMDRLSIPVSNRFTIAIQVDTNEQWYLDEYKIPSTPENWIYGGSIANNVTAFNNRTGNIVPMNNDYTAEMVGAVGIPLDDGKRRVFIGSTLVEELDPSIMIDTITGNEYKWIVNNGVATLTQI